MIKNNEKADDISKYHVLIAVASRLAMACFTNGLGMITTYGTEKDKPYLEFKVYAGPESIILYSGKIFDGANEMMNAIVDSITGKMVSELSPPAGSIYDGQKVIYWKRELVNRIDATRLGGNRPEVTQSKAQISWVGYDVDHKEVVRKHDGIANPGHYNVDRVEYVDLGPLGTVVAVVPYDLVKDETYPPSLGESIWMKERAEEANRLEMGKIASMATQTSQLPGLGTQFSNTLFSAQLGVLTTEQIKTLSSQMVAALTTSQLAALSTENIAELTMDPLGQFKQPNGEEIKPRSIIFEKVAGIGEDLSRTPSGLNIRYYIMLNNVRAIIPEPLDMHGFDLASSVQKSEYLEMVDEYRKLVEGNTLKETEHYTHNRICKFLRDVVESDMLQKVWADSMKALAAGQLHEFSTRSVFTGRFLQFSGVVMNELFGIEDPSRFAKTVEIPSEIGIFALSLKLGVPQQFVIDFLRQSNFIVHPDQGLDFPVSSLVVKKLGWNAVEVKSVVEDKIVPSVE